ncbi:hypothetical protein AB4Z45_27810 [Paenibacillus sp. MCAF9]|uniref:hypothetical protein n=1 Tax=Paenibacillus sp. MCAF9 TaxID=3233046 RepID=UPI003F9771A1
MSENKRKPTYVLIREMNQAQTERTQKVLRRAREVVNDIQRRHEEQRRFESAKASVEMECGPLSEAQMDLVRLKARGEISHADFLESAKMLARKGDSN